MEKLKGRWPEHMIIPSPEDFHYGLWVLSPDKKLQRDIVCGWLRDHPEVRDECGVKFCLVGFAALAFDEEGCVPYKIKNPATGQFLAKFLDLAGDKVRHPDNIEAICWAASRFFEESGITSEEVHELWIKTSRHFGYDV